MRKWTVRDRPGHEIYLTEEQWGHITDRHPELRGRLDDVLLALRQGHRQQQPHDPQAYVYRRPCDALRPPFNGILVLVAFRFEWRGGETLQPNNFVVTAWGIVMRRERQ